MKWQEEALVRPGSGSAPVLEDYFDLMPITLVKIHGEFLIKYLGLCSSQLFENENLTIVCGFGLIFLWMLRRRGLQSMGQQLLDKVSSKWPSILRSPFWLGDAETATEYVDMGAIDLDRGGIYMKILFVAGVQDLKDSIGKSNRRIKARIARRDKELRRLESMCDIVESRLSKVQPCMGREQRVCKTTATKVEEPRMLDISNHIT